MPIFSCQQFESAELKHPQPHNPPTVAELSAEVEQVIVSIVRFKLRASGEADDACQEVRLQLLERLRETGELPSAELCSLAATIAWRVCAADVRQRNPQFHALKNRIHYLLTRQAGLACWREADAPMGGFAAWQSKRKPLSPGKLRSLVADRQFAWRVGNLAEPQGRELVELLTALFNLAAAPVELNELVNVAAELLHLREPKLESLQSDDDEGVAELPGKDADISLQVEKRIFLQRLWEEVQLLPPNQRTALLLNLRDAEGRGCIALFLVTGVATLRQLAEALELTAERFAAVWNDLPLDDQTIAELLGLQRQQIINARKSARERLARRLKNFF
ncbi:MAG: hypothetical protein SF097_14895 [Acidobacteriota bacterium]|nr:hypothetical protein [Acidobacteriota bacterium]